MAEQPESLKLEVDRVLPAPATAVFAALADPHMLRRWWGPKGFSIPRLRFEPRIGETYQIEMQPPEGDAFHLTGEFREVDQPSRLAFTFNWDPPDVDDVETVAVLSIQDADGSARVSLSQGPFKTEERRELHRDGWTESFDRLETVLSGGR